MILLVHFLALRIKEAFQILLVDVMNIAVIHGFICGIFAVALARFELLLEVLSLTVHPDFH